MDDMTHKTVPVEPIIANLPKAIWLNVGELDPLDAPYDFDEINSHEDCVTWCDVPQDGFDIKYVRADLAEAAQPSPVTELEVMLAEAIDGILTADSMCSDACLIQSDDLQSRANKLHHDSMEKARAALAAFNAKKGG